MEASMLEAMKNTDVRTVDRNTLVDIKEVVIDVKAEPEKKLAQYLRQIKNPYCFLCGGYIVKLEFSKNGKTIEDCFSEYLDSLM